MTMHVLAACAAAALAFGAGLAPAAAETTTETALQTPLKGMPDSEANVVVFDVDPGWQTDEHHHPGHLFVYVLDGTLRVDVEGQEPQEYGPGEAFYEMPGISMVASNISADERAKFVVFQFGEAGEPIMVAD